MLEHPHDLFLPLLNEFNRLYQIVRDQKRYGNLTAEETAEEQLVRRGRGGKVEIQRRIYMYIFSHYLSLSFCSSLSSLPPYLLSLSLPPSPPFPPSPFPSPSLPPFRVTLSNLFISYSAISLFSRLELLTFSSIILLG